MKILTIFLKLIFEVMEQITQRVRQPIIGLLKTHGKFNVKKTIVNH